MLYININFPENVKVFAGYLSISTGNISAISDYIPNAADYLVNMNNVEEPSDNYTMPPTFA